MSILDSELVAYASANMPEDDSSTSGGAIDTKTRIEFTDLATNDKVEVVSDNAGDTQNCTVKGRIADGSIAQETLPLTGTTPVLFNTNTFERILSVSLASDAVGTVTVRRQASGPTVATIPPAERGFRRLFINAASDPALARDRFEKFFWKNTNATLALTSAQVLQNADPQNVITHALAATKDDTGSVANRLTDPGLTFDDAAKAVPSGNLGAGEAIGVWVKQSLSAGQAGFKDTYTSELTGNSV